MKGFRYSIFILAVLQLGGCASSLQTQTLLEQPPVDIPMQHRIRELPFFPQEAYQCGPAALATLLNSRGIASTPDSLVPMVYIPGQQGSYQLELLAASRALGGLAYTLEPSMDNLIQEVSANNPVLVLQNLSLAAFPQWHFAVVKGFDLERETVLLNSGIVEDYEVSMKTFERTWRRADYWAFTVVSPGQVPVTADPLQYFLAVVDFQESFGNQASVNQAYQAGLRYWPDDRNLNMAFANSLYEQGQYEHAAEIFRRVIAQHQDYAPAYNNLAHLFHEQGNYTEALQLATLATQLDGTGNAAYANTLRMIESSLADSQARH